MSDDAFENNGKYAMCVKLAANWMELVFEPFEVFLSGYVWKELIKHVFKGDGKEDKASGWWFARRVCDVSG